MAKSLDTEAFAVIVVHFGESSATVPMVRQLEADHTVPAIYLVDNGPDVERNDWSSLTRSHVVFAPRNEGYGGGANLGIDAAIESGYADVVVTATDANIDPGDIARLVEGGRAVGATIAGPRITYDDGATIWADGVDFDDRWAISKNRHKGCPLATTEPPENSAFLTGHVLAMFGVERREWLRFDPQFFMYYEDVDLCRRASRRGELVWLDSDVTIRHCKPGGTSYRFGSMQQYNMSRSAVMYNRKHARGVERFSAAMGLLALTAYRVTKSRDLNAAASSLQGLLVGAFRNDHGPHEYK